MKSTIVRIDITERDKRAIATFTCGQKLPMHYTSAERVFAMLYNNSACTRSLEKDNKVSVHGINVEVFKTYK